MQRFKFLDLVFHTYLCQSESYMRILAYSHVVVVPHSTKTFL